MVLDGRATSAFETSLNFKMANYYMNIVLQGLDILRKKNEENIEILGMTNGHSKSTGYKIIIWSS